MIPVLKPAVKGWASEAVARSRAEESAAVWSVVRKAKEQGTLGPDSPWINRSFFDLDKAFGMTG